MLSGREIEPDSLTKGRFSIPFHYSFYMSSLEKFQMFQILTYIKAVIYKNGKGILFISIC